eukprot:6174878-Pleurochrysis_carterae.AAC.1
MVATHAHFMNASSLAICVFLMVCAPASFTRVCFCACSRGHWNYNVGMRLLLLIKYFVYTGKVSSFDRLDKLLFEATGLHVSDTPAPKVRAKFRRKAGDAAGTNAAATKAAVAGAAGADAGTGAAWTGLDSSRWVQDYKGSSKLIKRALRSLPASITAEQVAELFSAREMLKRSIYGQDDRPISHHDLARLMRVTHSAYYDGLRTPLEELAH